MLRSQLLSQLSSPTTAPWRSRIDMGVCALKFAHKQRRQVVMDPKHSIVSTGMQYRGRRGGGKWLCLALGLMCDAENAI